MALKIADGRGAGETVIGLMGVGFVSHLSKSNAEEPSHGYSVELISGPKGLLA
jgi:hypothetical protein